MSLLPANLSHRLIEGDLPWDRSIELHISDFLEKYTLHDSNWICLLADCAFDDAATAVIGFDPVWNSSVSSPTSICADWPILFIQFKCASAVRLSRFRNADGVQRGISCVDIEHISDEEVNTVITDHYGGTVSIRHFPLIKALARSPDERILELGGRDS